MAVTEPGDLVNTAWDGDVPETKVTNEAASRPGFPARKADGTLVFIVDQFAVGTVKVLIDEDGNQYHDNQPTGALTPVTDETSETISEDDVQPELDDGVEPAETAEAVAEAVEETVGDETVEASDEQVAESA